jgi:hypothetical protein
LLLGDEHEIERRRAPPAGGLVDRHRDDAHLLHLIPQRGIEAERFGRAHAFRRGLLRVERAERFDELVLLRGASKIHRQVLGT